MSRKKSGKKTNGIVNGLAALNAQDKAAKEKYDKNYEKIFGKKSKY